MTEAALEQIAIARRALAEAVALLSPPPVEAHVIRRGDNLRSKLEQAPADTVFSVEPDFEMDGNLTLLKPVTLASTLTIEGRVSPGQAGGTVRGATLITAPAVMLKGLRLLGAIKDSTILTTGPQSVIDQCVLLGSPTGQHRGIAANSRDVSITRSYIGNIWKDQDTQAVAGWTGTANLVVDDCFLEASGENVLFGGADPATVDQIPHHITVRNCTLTKPLAWRTQAGVTCKNLLELKNCRHVLVENCLMERSWVSGQSGYGIVLTIRNQNGGAPWSTIEDVIIRQNHIRSVGAGVLILGRDDLATSSRMKNVTLSDNRFTDVNPVTWGKGATQAAGRQVSISGGPLNLQLLNNSFDGEHTTAALVFDQVQYPTEGFVVRGNRFLEGKYGIQGPAASVLGVAVLDRYAPGYQWQANTIIKGTSGRVIQYPNGTSVIAP